MCSFIFFTILLFLFLSELRACKILIFKMVHNLLKNKNIVKNQWGNTGNAHTFKFDNRSIQSNTF